MYIHIDILFHLTKVIPIMFERVTTYYQTLKTWIGHNATRYHTFNALPHALSHVLLYIFSHNAICYHNFNVLPYISSQCSMVWSYLQRVTTRYRQIYKEIYINIFLKKMMVTLGNALQIAQNQENHRENIR